MFGALLYVNFDRTHISALNVKTGAEFSLDAVIAISDNKIMAVGRQALEAEAVLKGEGKDVRLVRPFDDERTAIVDFEVASALVNYAVKNIIGFAFIKPVMIVHCLTQFSSPLSPVELRGISELGEAAGARKVLVSNEAGKYVRMQLQDAALLKKLGL